MPTSPPAGWYADPGGSGGRRYWDGERWTEHCRAAAGIARSPLAAVVDGVRRGWSAMPLALRFLLPIAFVLISAGIGVAFWLQSPPDNWARLPNHLECRIQEGPKPPDQIIVAAVQVEHPSAGVLELVIRFAEPLPQSPSGSHASGFVGYVLTFSVANNGRKFVELGPEEDTDDLAITATLTSNGNDVTMRPDRDTNARRTAPDTIEINLDLKRLGIENQLVVPTLTVDSQFNTPSTTTVEFASQVCT
ncbi:DUF2510 domain-containing protein [Mycobacterium marinum]|uniref:DUF2510 domain-containing protein n=1 Tax=Mycobacterium marinum TaxID=1781 RepID=UPI0021C4B53E|nr:DUF2510 domain-containing protein [Mycobacterium marinum]